MLTTGVTMLHVKKQFLQLINDARGLTFFVSQIILMSPDSSYLIAIDNFNKVLKSVLSAIFVLHEILFIHFLR